MCAFTAQRGVIHTANIFIDEGGFTISRSRELIHFFLVFLFDGGTRVRAVK